MATRTIEQKLYPLANYLTDKGISTYLDNENDYILDISTDSQSLANWSKTLVESEKGYTKISNLPNSSAKHQLFFFLLDYYYCNKSKEHFDFLLSTILKGFINYYNRTDLDFAFLVSELSKLNVPEEYISEVQSVIDKKSIKKIEPKKTNQIEATNAETVDNDIRYSQYFKLCSLTIRGYKNIENLTIDFTKKNGVTILIGNNGCGKSNIIEAISSIFSGLYKNRIHKPTFDFEISYQINFHSINIKLKSGRYTISVDDIALNKEIFESKRNEYLPKNVVACYSGENSRLFDEYFWLYYEDYISAVKKADKIPALPLLYVNKYCWEIALLTIYFYDFDTYTDLAKFCRDTLGINDLKNVTFTFDTKKAKEWKDNAVLNMVKHLNPEDKEKVTLTLDEIKTGLNYMSEKEFFQTMFAAFMPKTDKVITKIDLNLVLNNTSKSEISVNSLSEGEKKYLLMRLILEVLGDENSLLLFDEPDSHIHITRKAELKELFAKFRNRENIITTHSPTLALCFDLCHLESLRKNEDGCVEAIENKRHEIISDITGGMWNAHEQNIFLATNKNVILLVEGYTDKIHIENAFKHLKADYPCLEFDVFHADGADNLSQLVIGLRTCEVNYSDKKIIAVFDNDRSGVDNCNKTQVRYNSQKNKHGFYSIELPKTGKNDVTIENCYSKEKFSDAYLSAVNHYKDEFDCTFDKLNKKINNETKKILASKSGEFSQSDFEGFKPLFNIIDEINKL